MTGRRLLKQAEKMLSNSPLPGEEIVGRDLLVADNELIPHWVRGKERRVDAILTNRRLVLLANRTKDKLADIPLTSLVYASGPATFSSSLEITVTGGPHWLFRSR